MPDNDLLVIVPTRGRRGQCERLLKSFTETSTCADLLFVTDPDDQDTYAGLDWGNASTAVLEPRDYLSGKLNKTALAMADTYDVLMFVGDDHVFKTEAWDRIMLAALEDLGGSGWVYPDDKRRSDVPEIWMCSSDIVKTLGWFANPAVKHYYCVVPETLVLTSSLEWVPANTIHVGDELIGVDEFPPPGQTRKYRRSQVLARARRVADCVTVLLGDGRQVTCSAEHMFLVKSMKGQFVDGRCRFQDPERVRRTSYHWIEAGHLRPGDLISSPLRTWKTETSFEAGWLSGMFDGEGSLSFKSGRFLNPGLEVSQNPGPVLDRIEAGLKSMGVGFNRYMRDVTRDECMKLAISPRADAIELMGRLRPLRLKAEKLWENSSVHHGGAGRNFGVVADVKSVGNSEVISLTTSARTFLTNGLISHNCDNSIAELGKRSGLIRYCPEAEVPHLHYSTHPETEHDGVYRSTEDAFGASDLRAFQEWRGTQMANEVAVLRREFSPDVRWVLSRVGLPASSPLRGSRDSAGSRWRETSPSGRSRSPGRSPDWRNDR